MSLAIVEMLVKYVNLNQTIIPLFGMQFWVNDTVFLQGF